jgi:2-polyprenyl-3-methyl-5-hydroxy-6-metoxy-1,4-benzoquinol methylase
MRVGEGFTEWTNVVKAKPLLKKLIGLGYFEPRQICCRCIHPLWKQWIAQHSNSWYWPMLAPRDIPKQFREWNLVHGAPRGRTDAISKWKRRFMSADSIQRRRGPFSLQKNNTTREFEYPWAFHVAELKPDMRVLEIGGGLSGLQFVLDSIGCKVVNVDPGMDAQDWPCNQESMQELNKRFGTHVELVNTTIDRASLDEVSFDRAISISVIEHLTPHFAAETLRYVHSCLRPGGLFVLTTDLFLNLKPFSSRLENRFGANQDLRKLIDDGIWELLIGNRSHLYGFPEFSPDAILGNLEEFYIGAYPALAQCLVLKKR